ncbi:MAG: cation diffusion facilitator family transporter [Chloroflexota bacterium]|nr:cation diffusion facilitator family transporter [Chloroflexota bacterium]
MGQQALQREGHGHKHPSGPLGWFAAIFHLHGHEHEEKDVGADPAFKTQEGIRTVWIALAALGITTILQIAIVLLSGSVALLADTVHNLGDMLNSVPLLFAFYLARRAATRRYTYGFGRAEDVAGVIIVLSIIFSAGYILWESFWKLLDPQPIERLWWVAAAAVIGFMGNELVALFQIRTGNRIGSDALVADGLHARIDGLTSLVVLVAVAGSALGYPIVDPIVGLMIGSAIVFIARDAAKRIWYRLMDAVDPMVVDRIEQYAGDVAGVEEVVSIRVRWVGNQLHAEVGVGINEQLTLAETYAVVGEVRHALISYVRHLSVVTVEALPCATSDQRGASVMRILPPRYQAGGQVSAAPMGAAALQYDKNGDVAWNEMWGGYCELALAGGAPHRGTLLEPVHAAAIAADPTQYEWVLQELERGIALVTGLPVLRSDTPGWLGMECDNEEMALWLLRAIVVENVTVRREESALWFPAGPHFRLEREIKSVITVIAKTNHYWQEHVAGGIPDSEPVGVR